MWFQWVDPERPWAASNLPCDTSDMEGHPPRSPLAAVLRQCSGMTTGLAKGRSKPSPFARELFKIASRKNRTVMKELHNKNWIRAVACLDTPAQLHEFVNLSSMLSQETLTPGKRIASPGSGPKTAYIPQPQPMPRNSMDPFLGSSLQRSDWHTLSPNASCLAGSCSIREF